MNLYELTYNPFDISAYERFLLEVFNINVNTRPDVSYLDDTPHHNIRELLYYGCYTDDDFVDIELYVVKLANIDDYRIVQDVIYNLLSLNQTNHAFIAVYSDYSDKWFTSYLFLEYVVQENKLVNYRSRIDDYIHWCGSMSCEDVLIELVSVKISNYNLKSLLKNNNGSTLIEGLSDLIRKLDDHNDNSMMEFDSYEMVLEALLYIIKGIKPKSSLMCDVYDKILEVEKSSDETVTADTIYELYNHLNNQKSLSKTHIENVCEDTLIEYLSHNTIIRREDIVSYVKYAYDNRKLISKHIGEAIRNGGKAYTNMKIPLSIIYNIDSLDNLLENMKVLDFSINSCITVTTITYLIAKLKYVNKLIMGYEKPSIDQLYKSTLKNNIHMITSNTQSVNTARLLLSDDINIKYTDALNLYDEYEYISKKLADMNHDRPKTEIITDIINDYNRTHFHTKMNINFQKQYLEKNAYPPLVYQLDYSEVFNDKNGFDIIISNVEEVNLTGKKDIKKQLRRYEIYDNNQRYEYYYIEKALEIIDDNGIISLMISDEYKTSEDNKIRRLLKRHALLQVDKEKLIYRKDKPDDKHMINNKILQSKLNDNTWIELGE